MTTPLISADEKSSFDEYGAIAAALQPYIDSASTGDGAGMRRVWFDHARIVGTLDGQPMNMDPDAFCKLIDEAGGSPEAQARIVSIDCAGNAASARVEFLGWAGARFTDFFVLSKRDGEWKISGKVFDAHGRN